MRLPKDGKPGLVSTPDACVQPVYVNTDIQVSTDDN